MRTFRCARWRKYSFFISVMLFCGLSVPVAAYAKEDLSSLNGLWVVNFSKTKALWEASKIDTQVLETSLGGYRLDMDFSTSSMIEGVVLSGTPLRTPFKVSKDSNGNLLITVDKYGKRTFLWAMQGDGDVAVTVTDSPTLIMMKCDYAKYAGRWELDIPANDAFFTLLASQATQESKEQLREELTGSYLILSFLDGDFVMRWKTSKGEAIYSPFPSGNFGITEYEKTGCTSSRGVSLNFKNDDYIIMGFKGDDASLFLKRMKQ